MMTGLVKILFCPFVCPAEIHDITTELPDKLLRIRWLLESVFAHPGHGSGLFASYDIVGIDRIDPFQARHIDNPDNRNHSFLLFTQLMLHHIRKTVDGTKLKGLSVGKCKGMIGLVKSGQMHPAYRTTLFLVAGLKQHGFTRLDTLES